MKLLLDFVHDDSNSSSHNYDEDVYGPLQLIRPMPDKLRDYMTTKDYEDFCIRKIDPLLDELYEMEKSTEQRQSVLTAVVFVLFIGMFSLFFLDDTDLMFKLAPILMCMVICVFMVGLFMNCSFSGNQVHEAIRRECRNMADRCNTKNRAMKKNITIGFELVMKRVWRGSSHDSNGHHHQHYEWKARYIRVSVTDNNDTDDSSSNYQHL